MASTNKTSLGLNMWEASDKPVRQDFINDNKIIDERIAKLNSDLKRIETSLVSVPLTLAAGANTTYVLDISSKKFSSVCYAFAQVNSNHNIVLSTTLNGLSTSEITFRVDNFGSKDYTGNIYPFVVIIGK